MGWLSDLADICQADAPLCEHTWYGLGGPARWLFTPRDEQELSAVVVRCREEGVCWRVLGRGANVLVSDEGFDGAVIKLVGPAWEEVRFDGTCVHAAAGVDFPKLVRMTVEQALLGLENLAGIPGTVGGVIRMNAGGRHGCIGQYVDRVRVMESDGQRGARSAAELGFGYRSSRLDADIVTHATFALEPGDPVAGLAHHREIWTEKAASQPPVAARSAGCIFKNPSGQAAGKLIDEAGLKGQRCGAAEVSTRHGNFIVAHPGATAGDVLHLIGLVKERVRKSTGLELELEIEVW